MNASVLALALLGATMHSANSAPQEPHDTASVASADGTRIAYRRLGQGPGIVLLHGMAESALSHLQLAEALSGSFTVYLPDRRGRGASGPHGRDYSLRREVEDLDALLTRTGAHFVFGVSAGAIVVLEAATRLPAIQRAAVFDPPLLIRGSPSLDFVPRYDKEIAAGREAAALVTAMLSAELGPSAFKYLPRWLLEWLTTRMMASEEGKARPGDVTMRMLAPTLHYDFQLVAASDGLIQRLKDHKPELLLLGASKSPGYMRVALDSLQRALPRARRVEFSGLNHNASGNADQWGKPGIVAEPLRAFFGRRGDSLGL